MTSVDYVTAWYVKAAKYIDKTNISCAFVSTNSVSQGEQVPLLWKPLMNEYGININFAHRTFKWQSEAKQKAAVHCVIIGFSQKDDAFNKIIYSDGTPKKVKNINPYLLDGETVFIESKSKPLCDVPAIRKGNQPTDGGNLIIEASELDEFLEKEPLAQKYIKRLVGAKEYINSLDRYCLWLINVPPSELRKMPLVME